MSTFEIILTVVLIWAALFASGVFAFYVSKTRGKYKVEIVKSHREIWTFYYNNIDSLNKIFTDSNEPPTEKECEFLKLLFIHMEMSMDLIHLGLIKDVGDYKQDYKEILEFPKVRAYYLKTKQFRSKPLVKILDKLL